MDLHIHTCLSPCGDPKSVPTRIIRSAMKKGLHAVAVTDHNASENVSSVRSIAEKSRLTVFGGMEITTQEEIHILGIFDQDGPLHRMQELIYDHLNGTNDPEVFGPQYVVGPEDYVEDYNKHLLIGATDLDVETVITAIHDNDGLAIASHIDREAFGVFSQLGFIPENLDLDAVELSHRYTSSPYSFENIVFPFVTFSDAHHPEDVGRDTTTFLIAKPTVRELRQALNGENGRRIVCTSLS